MNSVFLRLGDWRSRRAVRLCLCHPYPLLVSAFALSWRQAFEPDRPLICPGIPALILGGLAFFPAARWWCTIAHTHTSCEIQARVLAAGGWRRRRAGRCPGGWFPGPRHKVGGPAWSASGTHMKSHETSGLRAFAILQLSHGHQRCMGLAHPCRAGLVPWRQVNLGGPRVSVPAGRALVSPGGVSRCTGWGAAWPCKAIPCKQWQRDVGCSPLGLLAAPRLGTARAVLCLVWRKGLFFKELVFLGINPQHAYPPL